MIKIINKKEGSNYLKRKGSCLLALSIISITYCFFELMIRMKNLQQSYVVLMFIMLGFFLAFGFIYISIDTIKKANKMNCYPDFVDFKSL